MAFPSEHKNPVPVQSEKLSGYYDSLLGTNSLEFADCVEAGSVDVMDGVAPSRVMDEHRQRLTDVEGAEFRCAFYAANPETCQDTKCRSWRNPSIAAVTRHALRDSNKNDATGGQSCAIRSLSHRKLAAAERWRYYYRIHGGTDVLEQNRPHWRQPAKDDGIPVQAGPHTQDIESTASMRAGQHELGQQYSCGESSRHEWVDDGSTAKVHGLGTLIQALLDLVLRQEARNEVLNAKIAAIEAQKSADRLKTQDELNVFKKTIMDFCSGKTSLSAALGLYEQRVDTAI